MDLPNVSRAVAVTIAIVAPAFPTEPHITVRLLNHGVAPPQVIAQAQDFVDHIFSAAGIKIRWQECAAPKCAPPESPAIIAVKINSDASPRSRRSALGVSLPGVLGGNRIGVFYSRIETVSRDTTVSLGASPGEILAHVIAHEMGHLLLNWKTHSQTGVMRDPWRMVEFSLMRSRKLFFTRHETGRMRRAVQGRNDSAARVAGGGFLCADRRRAEPIK
jgi:hypothetical protein